MVNLKAVAKNLGYETVQDMVEHAVMDGAAPGVCTDCGEIHDGDVEPDACGYECAYCGAEAVSSVAIIAGVM